MDPFMVIFIVTLLQNVLVCNGLSLRAQLEQLLGIGKGQDYTDEYQVNEKSQESLTESEDTESKSSQEMETEESLTRSKEDQDDDSSDYEDYDTNSQETYDLPEYTEYEKPIARVKKVFRDQHGRVWRKKHKRARYGTWVKGPKQAYPTHTEQAGGVEMKFIDVHREKKRNMYGQTIRPQGPNVPPVQNDELVVPSPPVTRQSGSQLASSPPGHPLRYREMIDIERSEVQDRYLKNRYPTQYKPEPEPPIPLQVDQPSQGTRFKLIKSNRPEKTLEYAQAREHEREPENTSQGKLPETQVGIVNTNRGRFSESNRPESQFSESSRPERQYSGSNRPERQYSGSNRQEKQYPGLNRQEKQYSELNRQEKQFPGLNRQEKQYPGLNRQEKQYSGSNRQEKQYSGPKRQEKQYSGSNRQEKQYSESNRQEKQYSGSHHPEEQYSGSNLHEKRFSGSSHPKIQLVESNRPVKEILYVDSHYAPENQQGTYPQSNRQERPYIESNRQPIQNDYLEPARFPQEYQQDTGSAPYSQESQDPIMNELERKKLINYTPYIVRGIKTYVKRKAFHDRMRDRSEFDMMYE